MPAGRSWAKTQTATTSDVMAMRVTLSVRRSVEPIPNQSLMPGLSV
jgi:hypothetical protein